MKKILILLAVCGYSVFAKHEMEGDTVLPEKIDVLETEALNGLLQNLNAANLSLIDEFVDFSAMFNYEETEDLSKSILDATDIPDLSKIPLKDHPHAHLNVKEIIELYEYKLEVHNVETEDGYILELHRITGNKSIPSSEGKPVIFLMHGILASSSDWVLTGPERGFAFILADAGYDVWMGNARGNRYSREHKTINPKKKKFWQFTWHEIGIYDLPVMIDYALEHTNNTNLIYVGHSQGSTSFLVMLSERPEYNDKIKVMFSLAPVAYCSHMYSPLLKYTAKFEKSLRTLLNPLGPWEVLPNRGLYKIITTAVCKGALKKLCTNMMFLLSGFNEDQMDMELVPAITAHLPAGSSVYQFFHYAQLIKSGHFRQYDDKIVGSSNPPSYNFDNMKVPISLHFGKNDWLSDGEDVKFLYSKLPNPIGITAVPHEKFNHIDFLYAIDVKALVYDGIMETMLQYQD